MINVKSTHFLFVAVGLLLFLTSCHMGQSNYMTNQEREQLDNAYDSLQTTYKTLMAEYEADADSLPGELQSLYSQMQQMHQQMDNNHRQMMGMHMGRHMQGNKMMAERMGMQMQGRMTGEWYDQMMSMHERMAHMHQEMGQQPMAKMNRRLSEGFGKMRQMTPETDEPSDVPFNEEGDPSLLNGESLFVQNCASCHGNDAEGVGRTFPPLVNSDWITGEKSVPVRILLHGLSGEIEVNGQSYQGSMPSFKARLSAAKIAAILNYLRVESDGDFSEISKDDIIRIDENYSDRKTPWRAEDFDIN